MNRISNLTYIHFLFALLPFFLLGQIDSSFLVNQKGVKPKIEKSIYSLSITKAVVIGISDYQDPDIPDLQYAHRDAEEFANYLVSPTGGRMDKGDIQLLINQEATGAKVGAALDGLLDNCKKGDVVVIYFSGHGDVERKIFSQPGFLLCWNAPANIYSAGGTYFLPYLQLLINTLSIEKGVKVILITDACHAGKLAGKSIGGAGLTTANLAIQYANEIKILSCQPDEYSIEGQQWGEGRGVFSYYLIDGLNGLADMNGDNKVTLLEIGRFLEDHVAREVDPQRQNPVIIGNKSDCLVLVDSLQLNNIRKNRARESKSFSSTASRGFEDEILAKLDSIVIKKYFAFKSAIQKREFFKPSGNCADDLFEQLLKEKGIETLKGYIRRNYAAALQDDVQQVLNNWMKNDPREIALSKSIKTEKYKEYPRYLERAAELLGPNHYMYSTIQARKLFFEGYLLALPNQNYDPELAGKVLTKFRSALQYQEDMPQAYWQMSNVFGYNLNQPDSMEYYTQKVYEMYPKWITPLTDIAIHLYRKFNRMERARHYMNLANRIDSNSIIVLYRWGDYFNCTRQFGEAEIYLKKALVIDSTAIFGLHNLANVYKDSKRYEEAIAQYHKILKLDSTQPKTLHNLGCTYLILKQYGKGIYYLLQAVQYDSAYTHNYDYLGMAYQAIGRYEESELMFQKALHLDSNSVYVKMRLAELYLNSNRNIDAEIQIKKTIQSRPDFALAVKVLGQIYLKNKNFEEAENQFLKAIQLDSFTYEAYYYLACIKCMQGLKDLAFEYLHKAVEHGFEDYELLTQGSELKVLRENRRKWKRVIQKYNHRGLYIN